MASLQREGRLKEGTLSLVCHRLNWSCFLLGRIVEISFLVRVLHDSLIKLALIDVMKFALCSLRRCSDLIFVSIHAHT